MDTDIPKGMPFSRAYLRPDVPLKDSEKFRLRVSALFDVLKLHDANLARPIQLYGGIKVPIGGAGYAWESFFKSAPLADVLDAISIIYSQLKHDTPQSDGHIWKRNVAQILDQQAMGYRLDDACGVRALVDEEFQRNRFSAINALGKPRYKVALEFYEKGSVALEQSPPDTAGMVRSVFLANEELFKLMFGVARLTASNARQHLQPETSATSQASRVASQEMANSFAKWVAAAHQYRHAPGSSDAEEESPASPSMDLALVMFSTGGAFLRWLVSQEGP